MENEDKQQPQQSLYGLLATSEETCVCILQVASCFMLKEISTQQMFHISFQLITWWYFQYLLFIDGYDDVSNLTPQLSAVSILEVNL